MKEGLDNKFSNEFYKKANAKHLKNKGINQYYEGDEEFEESEGQLLYEKQREYYLKMLGEEKVKNIEDLTNLEVQKKNEEIEQMNQEEINNNQENEENNNENIEENNEHNCQVVPLNEQIKEERKPCNPLKKKKILLYFRLISNWLKIKIMPLFAVYTIPKCLLLIKKKIREIIKECPLA